MPATRRRARFLLALYAFCTVYLIPIFPHFDSANEISRWVSVAGLLEHGTLDTRWSEPLVGKLVDASLFQGHVYSNKPPGLALLGVPGYLAVRPFLGPPTRGNVRWSWLAMRLSAVTVPAVLLGLLVVAWPEPDPLAVGTLLFATPVFLYGMLLFSHVTAALCLYAAFVCLFGPPGRPEAIRRDLLAGFLCGFGVITEYTLALPVIVLGIVLLFSADRFRRLTRFVIAGTAWAILLGIYDRRLFGSFVSTSASHEAWIDPADIRAGGLFGIRWPTGAGFWTVTGSFSRGLLFFSPVLILGLVAMIPRGTRRSWARFLIVATLLAAIAGYAGNDGGWCAGARYLVPIVPFFVDAMHERRVRPGGLVAFLLAFSAILCVLPVLTFPFVPVEFNFLHATFTRPLLSAGFLTPNWGNFLVGGWPAMTPVVLGVVAALVLALLDGKWRALAGATAGAALAFAVVLAPVREDPNLATLRALILDTHFRPAGRMIRLASESVEPDQRAYREYLARAASATRWLAPDDWPYLPHR